MKRWTFPEGKLYLADCLDLMGRMPDDSVDLVVGSPPYEAARDYLENGENLGIALDTEEWVAWMVKVVRESVRVCKGLVAYVVGHGRSGPSNWTAGPALLTADLKRAGFCFLRNPVLYKRNGIMGSGQKDWLRANYEWTVCCCKHERLPWSDNLAFGTPLKCAPGGGPSYRKRDGTRINQEDMNGELLRVMHEQGMNKGEAANFLGIKLPPGLTLNHLGRKIVKRPYVPPKLANPGLILDMGSSGGGKSGSNIAHDNEAPYPARIPEFFIKSFCPPGGTVLECFAGSGTTVAEAIKAGRQFIACDIRQSQVNLTIRRIRQSKASKGFGIV